MIFAWAVILVISLLISPPDAAEQQSRALPPNITVWIFNSSGPDWTVVSVQNASMGFCGEPFKDRANTFFYP